MKKNTLFFLLPLVLFLFTGEIIPEKASKTYVYNYENVLGTSYEIKLQAISQAASTLAETKALQEIDRLNKILSGYDPKSEFSTWQSGPKTPQKVSNELFEVLGLFDQWRVKSGGALDASAELLVKIWKKASLSNREPSHSELVSAIQSIKLPHWKLDSFNHTAQKLDEVPVRLNSFAKSYIINKACDIALGTKGITGVVINIGGDIVVRGNKLETIVVSDPKADAENDAPITRLDIRNKAIATSGNYRRGEMVNGKWHSHIVDPRTGYPADQIISATVVAENPTVAGALATAFNVLSPEESEKLADLFPDTEYLIVQQDGKQIESKGWKNLENPIPIEKQTSLEKGSNAITKVFPSDGKLWDPNYELVINLELAEIEGIRVHRPYVAIWVVDKDKKPVKSIALWYNKAKYLDDMHAWYDTYYSRFKEAESNISSTTSATRSPGKYKIKWDGKNDNGNYVALGTYTLMIEVAREHGTYQLMSKELDFKQKFKPVTLNSNPEVNSVGIEYSKKSNLE